MSKTNHAIVGLGVAILTGLDPFLSLFASLLPDGDLAFERGKGKGLLTSHRGITHHAILIPLLLSLTLLSHHLLPPPVPHFVASFSVGYSLHLLCDALTPLGIPYELSYYPRFSLNLFRTGSFVEHLLSFLFVLCVGVYVLLRPEVLLLPLHHYLSLLSLVLKP